MEVGPGGRAAKAQRGSMLGRWRRHHPDGEREEVRQIFAAKGFSGDVLDEIVEVITSDRELWVDTMLREELGLQVEGPNPLRAALATFGAFVLVGFFPLLPFLLQSFSSAMTLGDHRSSNRPSFSAKLIGACVMVRSMESSSPSGRSRKPSTAGPRARAVLTAPGKVFRFDTHPDGRILLALSEGTAERSHEVRLLRGALAGPR